MKTTDRVRLPKTNEMPRVWQGALANLRAAGQVLNCNEHPEDGCDHGDETGGCCRRHAVVLPGYGKRNYPFPTPDELVARAIAYFNALAREYEKMGRKLQIGSEQGEGQELRQDFLAFVSATLHTLRSRPGDATRRRQMREQAWQQARGGLRGVQGVSLPKIPVDKLILDMEGVPTQTGGPTLRVAAGTLAEIMHEGRFKAVIARQFDPFKGAVSWALNSMPEKYRPEKYREAASSLADQLQKLEEIYAESLPRVIQFLGAQYPHAAEGELLDAAVSVLNEQLTEILFVLSIWTDSFAQRRDGMYTQLEYVHFTVEQALRLFQTGDTMARDEKGFKTHAYHVGDVFMARFSDQGPATIPGGRGPVGAHAIEVPFDEQDVIVIYLPLYLHEFRHDYYNDVEGLQDSMTEAVVTAIQKAIKDGKFKFASDTIMLGKQTVRTGDLLTQIYGQTLPETDADIAGGASLSGESFLYSMLATFCAFNVRGYNAFAVNRMLRHSSVFAVGEQAELAFEPHMPDYMRAYVVAAALEIQGFKAEADECRRLADQAAGVPLPTHIIWRNIDPKSRYRFEIKVPVSDLKQVAPVVADAILNAPLAALGGLSTAKMVNWTPKRQEKVDALAKNLMNGSSQIPWEMGDFWAPYVAAAAIKALWGLWKDGGLPPTYAAAFVEANARKMMDQVKERFEQLEATQAAANPSAPDDGAADAKDADGADGSDKKPVARESDATTPGDASQA